MYARLALFFSFLCLVFLDHSARCARYERWCLDRQLRLLPYRPNARR